MQITVRGITRVSQILMKTGGGGGNERDQNGKSYGLV